jgi:hypothetical protein
MSFRFHPAAEAEFSDAIQYYEDVEPGLGQDFAVEGGQSKGTFLLDCFYSISYAR